ncbi:MAG: pyrimidine 5'-nucleotidase [Alphaproteobacteria bacterium]|jgi:putative hydrolase of the HAD superfamily|tara:strand:- start:10621 stop:11304 length:684 start_codon:yes stop_codon:yes gene_type:complete
MNHIKNWVFDLDNTLYKAECGLFDKVHILMGKFIEEKLGIDSGSAQTLRTKYYHKYGTTLRGLMSEHQIDPNEYLDYVHQINYEVVSPNEGLAKTIKNLKGKKYIFTNANYGHAEKVLDKLKMNDVFDGCFDISESDYQPKPHKPIYDAFQKKFNLPNNETAMFEDLHINLKCPHELGWTTVWITNNLEYNLNRDIKIQSDIQKIMEEKKYIDHTTDQLENFLNKVQ